MGLTRDQIIETARKFLGTPYKHQHHYLGVGVDCIGLVIGVAQMLDCLPNDFRPPVYRMSPDPEAFLSVLRQYLVPIDYRDAELADVIGMDHGHGLQHVGFLSYDNKLIHSCRELRKVSEHGIDLAWQERIDRASIAFSWRDLIEKV